MEQPYTPLPPPQDVSNLPLYLNRELNRIASVLTLQAEPPPSATVYDDAPPTSLVVGSGATAKITTPDTVLTEDRVTADVVADELTILEDGRYTVSVTYSVSGDANNLTLTFTPFLNGVAAPISASFFLKQSGDPQTFSASVNLDLKRGDVLDERVSHDSGGSRTLTFETTVLTVVKQVS